jgi:hypothetical protein
MSIRDRSRSLVRKRTIELPGRGETVVVRGLFLGKSRDLGSAPDAKRAQLTIACTLEDPQTGELFFDENNLDDLRWIDENFDLADTTLCADTAAELSGVKKPGKEASLGASDTQGSTQIQTASSPIGSSSEASEDEPSQN